MYPLLLALATLVAVAGGDRSLGELRLLSATASPAPAGAESLVLLHIENGTDVRLQVLRATSPVAVAVRGHHLAPEGPERPAHSSGFVIAGGATLRMSADGAHLVLSGLTRELRVGDAIPLVLHCPDGLTLNLQLLVRDPGRPGH
jgi:copper(I)-binding protein